MQMIALVRSDIKSTAFGARHTMVRLRIVSNVDPIVHLSVAAGQVVNFNLAEIVECADCRDPQCISVRY